MKKIILMAVTLFCLAMTAGAQSEPFFKGLKNTVVLNINDILKEGGLTFAYNDAKDLYSSAKIYYDDFFGGVTLSMKHANKNEEAISSLSAAATVGSDGFKGDADSLFKYNSYVMGFYDFNKDGKDEWVIVACSNNEGANAMAMMVAFPCSEINGNFAFEEPLGDVPAGKMKAELKDGLIVVTSVKTGKPVFKLKWNQDRFEEIND